MGGILMLDKEWYQGLGEAVGTDHAEKLHIFDMIELGKTYGMQREEWYDQRDNGEKWSVQQFWGWHF